MNKKKQQLTQYGEAHLNCTEEGRRFVGPWQTEVGCKYRVEVRKDAVPSKFHGPLSASNRKQSG